MKGLARILAAIGVFGTTTTACTTTYTEADVQKEAVQDAAEVRSEEASDERLGEEGGDNRESIDEEAEWVDRESDL